MSELEVDQPNDRNLNELNKNVFGFRNRMNFTTERFRKAPKSYCLDFGHLLYCLDCHHFFFQTLDELTDDAIPENIRLKRDLHLEKPYSETFSILFLTLRLYPE